MMGATPTTMRVTLATSPKPTTMKRIGRIASGGINDTAATNGATAALRYGSTPIASPRHSPPSALIDSATSNRCRLARVSVQNR